MTSDEAKRKGLTFIERVCEIKVAYKSKRDAKVASKRIGGNIKPYACGYCGLYHVGHSSKRFANKPKSD